MGPFFLHGGFERSIHALGGLWYGGDTRPVSESLPDPSWWTQAMWTPRVHTRCGFTALDPEKHAENAYGVDLSLRDTRRRRKVTHRHGERPPLTRNVTKWLPFVRIFCDDFMSTISYPGCRVVQLRSFFGFRPNFDPCDLFPRDCLEVSFVRVGDGLAIGGGPCSSEFPRLKSRRRAAKWGKTSRPVRHHSEQCCKVRGRVIDRALPASA